MIIKSFAAETAAAALKLVRREMGGDAIVLKTRQLAADRNGARVEVTACLEKASAYQSSEILSNRLDAETFSGGAETPPAPVTDAEPISAEPTSTEPINAALIERSRKAPDIYGRLDNMERKLDRLITAGQPAAQQGEPTVFDTIRDNLKDADLSDDLIASIIGAVAVHPSAATDPQTAVHELLVPRLAELMEPGLMFVPGDRVVFVGPAGAGKSTVMGKVAAQLTVQAKMKVTLTTLDNCKMAAADEVRRYADVLNASLVDAFEFEPDTKVISEAVTLIDTPALPARQDSLDQLKEAIDTINPTCCVAVFSSLMRTNDALAIAESMQTLMPTHLAVTMTDLTDRFGTAVSISDATGWKIAMIGDAPGGIGHIRQPDPDRTARLLLKTEVSGD